MDPKRLDQKNKMERQSHQTVCTSMVKINQAQMPVGSIQERVPLSRVKANPDDDDDGVNDDVDDDMMIRQTSNICEDKVNVRGLVALHDCFRQVGLGILQSWEITHHSCRWV